MAVLRFYLPLVLAVWACSLAVSEPLPAGAVGRLAADGVRDGYTSLWFSADGKQLVAVHTGGTLRVWDLASRKPTRAISFEHRIGAWAMTPDRSHMVGVDEQLTVYRLP